MTNRVLRHISLVATAAAIALGVACRQVPRDNAPVVLATFSRAIDYSPFYVAKYFKWFEGEPALRGRQVNYREFDDRSLIDAAIDRNELTAIFAAEPPVIITRNTGRRLRIVEVSCTLQQEIVTEISRGILDVSGLRGKRVAVLQTTSSEYGLRQALIQSAIDTTALEIVYMGPSEAKAAFEQRQIDAWAVWPPFVEEQVISGRGRAVRGGDAVIQSVMAIPDNVLTKQAEASAAIVEVIRRAKNWIMANPEEAQRIVSTELDLPPAVVRLAWSKHQWGARLDDAVIIDIQNKANFLRSAGVIKDSIVVRRDLLVDTTSRLR
ncbi:MAG: ABC transporter substrate-binding protein [Gemmatimonadales bacterium]